MSNLANHRVFLQDAARYLENPNFLVRLAGTVGRPLETTAKQILPRKLMEITTTALRRAMDLAAHTVPASGQDRDLRQSYETAGRVGFWHTLAAVASGTAGGLLGLSGLALELPVTTAILFRSIAAIAVQFGEDLRDPAVRLECLAVFSHGIPAARGKGTESSYFTARLAMASLVRDAALFLTRHSGEQATEALARGTAPALVEFLAYVAAEFNVAVTSKALAAGIPLLGSATGAAINAVFADHFNAVARFHFGIRNLEASFGADAVREAYQAELEALRAQPTSGGLEPARFPGG